MFTVPPTLQSFGEVVAQKFQRPESRALPTFGSAEAGNATPKAAFRSLELAVPTRSGYGKRAKAVGQRSRFLSQDDALALPVIRIVELLNARRTAFQDWNSLAR